MGKTADLTIVKKTIIDTLHKEGKPQTFTAKEAGCSQSAVSKHVNRKLSGRKKFGRKRCTPTKRTAALWGLSSKIDSNLGELHKEWTEAGVKALRATTHRRVKEFGYSCCQRRLTWAKEKKNWTVAQWSSFQMRASFAFHLETKVLESGGRVEKLIAQVAWSPVLSFHSLWYLGCNVICWCWSIVFFENQRHCTRLPRNFGALLLTTFKDADFIFQQDLHLPHCQKNQKLVKWPWCWCAWLASNSPDLNP